MTALMNICVYGAASNQIDISFRMAAEELGKEIVRRGYGVVFGGGGEGVMGGVARGVHGMNGTLIGITPSFFKVDGVLSDQCTEMVYTNTMRERKLQLENRSDAFIIAPGGIGTFDEFFEILTLRHLNQHDKPISVLNTNGYYDKLDEFLRSGVSQNFIHDDALLYTMYRDPAQLMDALDKLLKNS